MKSRIDISIIIPTYNRGNFILNAVNSVINQSFSNWELLIIDDGSSDNTRDIISPYLKDLRIKYFRQLNSGAPRARNYGLQEATGNYILFLDSDDEIEHRKLEKHFTLLQKMDLDVCVSEMLEVNHENGYQRFIKKIKPCGNLAYEYITKRIKWPTHTPIWKKEFLLREAGFDENLIANQDYEFYSRLLLNKPKVGYINEVLSIVNNYRSSEDKVKIRKNRRDIKKVKNRIKSRISVLRSVKKSDLDLGVKLRIILYLYKQVLAGILVTYKISLFKGLRFSYWLLTKGFFYKPHNN